MSEMTRIFNGKMNLDASPYRMPKEDYIDALNITTDAEGESKDKVISGVVGNVLVDYSLPEGTNKCIGQFDDVVRNRIYYFIWNSNGYHRWAYWNAGTNAVTTLIEDLTDTNNVPVLDFNPSKRINHIDVIYRDQSEGDLLFWTDGNTPPKKANVKRIEDGDYSVIKAAFIEVAKAPFLSAPTVAYGSDPDRNANSLRRKLFQFAHRPVYDDFEKATLSTFSKIPMPVGFYGSDNDTDNTKNNFITIGVETGDENVIAVEIVMRSNINNAWSDFVLVATLNKEQLLLPDNASYQFLFYNDQIYPPLEQGVQYVDEIQNVLLYDWVPQKANCGVLGNGTTPIYGAITEGYDNFPISELDITLTAENVKNVPPDADPPSVTYIGPTFGNVFIFTVSGTIPTGTVFTAQAFIYSLLDNIELYNYTSLPGDTISDVVNGIFASIDPAYQNGSASPDFYVALGSNSFVISTTTTVPTSAGQISTEKTWMWDANYIMGLVYVDEQNRDMPGVTTYANPVNPDNDFMVTTPPFELDGTDVKTPVISATINHTPPDGAKAVYWVRRRMTYGSFVMYMTCDFQSDSDFYYLCLANIEQYKEDNSQFIYSTATITEETRVKVIAGVTAGVYNGNIWTQDYQVLGTPTRTLTGGTTPGDDRQFLKIKIPSGAPSPAYSANMLVMVYTPAVNPTTLADSVYYEWSESYEIYELFTLNYLNLAGTFQTGEVVVGSESGATGTIFFDSGGYMYVENVVGRFNEGEVITGSTSGATADTTTITSQLYHRGGDQDQTPFQEAEYTWEEGDVYFHQRTMDTEILSDPYATATLNIMDANFSDFFNSAVNDNGRGQAIEVNARSQYNPVLVRFGGEYQAGTNINNTNRFIFENFDEYDRNYADIMKLFIDKRYMYVFQKFDTGVVPVFTQIVSDTAGNPLQANSEQLLNKIAYPYGGKLGLGDSAESFAFGKYAKYGVDTNKGVAWRLSQDGMTPLSVLYECNSFFVEKTASFGKGLDNGNAPTGGVYTGNPTILGTFNAYTNKYTIAFEEINRYNDDGDLTFHQDAYTIAFNEVRNSEEGFQTFLSYHPEMMGCLNNLLVTWLNGQLWLHNSDTYANFYGTQYDVYITPIFNDNPIEKKSFNAVIEVSNVKWECPEIFTDIMSYGNTPQSSSIVNGELVQLEGSYHASFKRDANSVGGKWNGNFLKGKYVRVKFKATDPSVFSLLNTATVKYVTSPLSI